MSPRTQEPSLGRRLLEHGWRQGRLLSARGTQHTWARRVRGEAGTEERWEWIAEPLSSETWWVVASQDCDIAAKAEPRIELLRAFWTTDKDILRMARLNSARRYLLSRRLSEDGKEEGLVVDATVHLSVEKESLEGLSPSEEVPRLDLDAARRFGEWLARRYARPAIANPLVEAIQKPLVEALRKLQKKEDGPLWEYLTSIDQVLFSTTGAAPPFRVSFVCLIASEAQLDPLARAEISGWFADELQRDDQVRLEAVEFRTAASISLADYLAGTPLSLDEFSIEGG